MDKKEFEKKYVGENKFVYCKNEEDFKEFLQLVDGFGFLACFGDNYSKVGLKIGDAVNLKHGYCCKHNDSQIHNLELIEFESQKDIDFNLKMKLRDRFIELYVGKDKVVRCHNENEIMDCSKMAKKFGFDVFGGKECSCVEEMLSWDKYVEGTPCFYFYANKIVLDNCTDHKIVDYDVKWDKPKTQNVGVSACGFELEVEDQKEFSILEVAKITEGNPDIVFWVVGLPKTGNDCVRFAYYNKNYGDALCWCKSDTLDVFQPVVFNCSAMSLKFSKIKPKQYSNVEKLIAKEIDPEFGWMVREDNDWIYLHMSKPKFDKSESMWVSNGDSERLIAFSHLYKAININDPEPTSIADIVGEVDG